MSMAVLVLTAAQRRQMPSYVSLIFSLKENDLRMTMDSMDRI